ncbi:RNA pseudouridine synthase [Hydrogenovibrio sp. 3SP14C1]|uniref:RluA family pseudouridine synthase n=1 Tax=Hydrogenovibrio sp. 3SP14C1 TaxID=3038774 RepID=UPI002416892A|nr:RNA pseudouridine synthase [Hydrogenovibrio sp. 3SP14C1]MDG4812274.1 RNA pseudouridine synthase [Hydrogenovibrio sp. 3SP14C1]
MTVTSNIAPFELHFTVQQSEKTLLEALSEQLPSNVHFSNQQLKRFCQQGAVWVSEPLNQPQKHSKKTRVRRAKKVLKEGAEVSFYFNEAVLNTEISPPVLIEDCGDFSVWYKPKGVLSQGSKWGDHTTLNRWIETQYAFETPPEKRPCWIIHRLDKATDGLMLIAHSKKSAQRLAHRFETHQIGKTYQAWVKGQFSEQERSFDQEVDGKPALSFARQLFYDADNQCSLVQVNIATGRKHQIRVHLSNAGFPIIGDRLYGDAQEGDPDLQLTAVEITFLSPQGTIEQRFQLPDNLQPSVSI